MTAGRAYLSRLKRQVCETLGNPPLVVAADAGRFRTTAGNSESQVVIAAAARADPHDDQNLAASFRPLALNAPPRSTFLGRSEPLLLPPPW